MANNRQIRGDKHPIHEEVLTDAGSMVYSPDGSKVESVVIDGETLVVTDGVLSAVAPEAVAGDAATTTYDPTTPGDWETPPENVEEALDELAGREAGGGGSAKMAIFTVTEQAGGTAETIILFDELTVYDSSGVDITEDDTTFTLTSGTAYVNEGGIYVVDARIDLSTAVTGGPGKDVAVTVGAGRDPAGFVASHIDGATDGQIFRVFRQTTFYVYDAITPAGMNASLGRIGTSIGTWGGTDITATYRVTKLG